MEHRHLNWNLFLHSARLVLIKLSPFAAIPLTPVNERSLPPHRFTFISNLAIHWRCSRYLSPQAGLLAGAVYFTYKQGIWGDQQDVTECIKRWREYVRSINTRRPPTFDSKGCVVVSMPYYVQVGLKVVYFNIDSSVLPVLIQISNVPM